MIPHGSPSSLPRVDLEQFQGPLDLLVEEVRRQNVAIEDIAMAPIVARFLAYVESAAERSINLDIEWLHMAAILIHWKSRSLLAAESAAPSGSDPIRDEVVRELVAYRAQAAEELARRQAVEELRFSRRETPESRLPEEIHAEFVSVWDLIGEARTLAAWAEEQREGRSRWRETLGVESDDSSVEAMMEYLRRRLPANGSRIDGAALLRAQPNRVTSACLFLGMLQMVADQELMVDQFEHCGPMWLSPVECG